MNKIIKILLIIIINFILLICFLLMLEGILFWKVSPLKKSDFNIEDVKHRFRVAGENYKNPPVLVYGGSFAYGATLNDKQYFGAVLSELTKRPVYTFGIEGRGIQQALYIIKNQKIITPQPDYVVYIYIDDHIRRLYQTCIKIAPFNLLEYEEKDGILVQKHDKLAPIKNTLTYKYIMSDWIYPRISHEKRFRLLKLYLKEMRREIKNKYPNAKFIFLIYEKKSYKNLLLSEDWLDELKALDIEIIDLDEIFGKELYKEEYRCIADHPSAKAWKIVTPKIVEIEKM